MRFIASQANHSRKINEETVIPCIIMVLVRKNDFNK